MRKFIKIIPTSIMLLLTSCVSPLEQGGQNFERDSRMCTQGELTQQNALQRRECINQAFISRSQESGATNMDAVYQTATANKTAAIAYSEGKISKEQYQAIAAQNDTNYNQSNNQATNSSLANAIAVYGQTRANSDAAKIKALQESTPQQSTTTCQNWGVGQVRCDTTSH